MQEVKKLGVLSLARVAGLFGIIYGLFSAVFVLLARTNSEVAAQLGGMFDQLGYSILVVFPVINGVIYFLFGVILAWIYNIIARKIGGVQIDLSEEKKPKRKK